MTKASDTQVGGDHYKAMGDFQPWDVLAHWLTPEEYRGYQKGVAIAYLARERSKGGDQDIRKAVHHLQRLVEELDAQAATLKADQQAEILTKFMDGVRFGEPINHGPFMTGDQLARFEGAPMQSLGLPIIDQPTDGLKCAEICCGNFTTCTKPCAPRVNQQADADGWIEWNGGECPVPEGVRVEYRMGKDGDTSTDTQPAECLRWAHCDCSSDITEYRIINPTT